MTLAARDNQLRWLSLFLHATGIGLLLLGTTLGYYTAVRPMVAQQASMEQEVEQLTAMVQKAPAIRREHEEAVRRAQQFRDRMDAMRKRIPDEPADAEYLTQLAELAGHEQVAIQNYQRGEVVDLKEHARLTVQLTLLASYPRLCRFLHQVNQMGRISTVEKLEVRSSSADEVLPVQLTLVLYYTVANQSPKGAAL